MQMLVVFDNVFGQDLLGNNWVQGNIFKFIFTLHEKLNNNSTNFSKVGGKQTKI